MGKRVKTWVYRDPRWAVMRLEAKRRDGWQCVKCGSRGHLEVDHIKPLRRDGEPFALTNLQTLCRRCHSAKTALETGITQPLPPMRAAWREFLKQQARDNGGIISC